MPNLHAKDPETTTAEAACERCDSRPAAGATLAEADVEHEHELDADNRRRGLTAGYPSQS